MTRMTENLGRTIIEGQRDKIMDAVLEKIMVSQEYEEYIEDRVENVVSDLVRVFHQTDD